MPDGQGRLVRRGTARSRSGCITCKIRHVKCGEEKPNCLKCVSSGRKCDGYSTETQMQHRARLEQAYRRPTMSFSADHTLVMTPGSKQERQYLNTFYAQGAGCVSGLISSDLWNHLIPQLIHQQPMIRHAVAAVSAACLEQFCPIGSSVSQNSVIALRQYNKAINEFVDFASKAQNQEFEQMLVGCILFICLEMVRGDQDQALSHLDGALQLMQKYRARTGDRALDSPVFQFLCRLNNQQPYLGRAIVPLESEADFKDMDKEPMHFENTEQARAMITTMQRRTIMFNGSMSLNENGELATEKMQQEYNAILQMSPAWEAAFQKFIVESAKKARPLDPRAIFALEIAHHTCTVYAKTCLSHIESDYDVHMSHWEAIIHAAEQILLLSADPQNITSPLSKLFSIEAEITPMVSFTAARCRDPLLRRRAVSVLACHPKREGFWNTKVAHRLVERVIEFEEANLAALPIEQRIPLENQRLCLAYAAATQGVYRNPVPVFMMWKPDGPKNAVKTWWEYLNWQ
ncbi:hypothetical protein N7540_002915 [Penicillium herquei]|nr:hypothetical protein N7540_002915 [Penicillium herquei]